MAPPDLEKEQYLAQLLSDSAEVRQGAIDFFVARADSVLPLLLEQARIGLLPAYAAPIFGKLGPAALAPLFALTGNRSIPEGVLPTLIAGIGPVALPELQKRASGSDGAVAAVAVNALHELGPQAKDSVPTLLDLTRNAAAVTLRVGRGRGRAAYRAGQSRDSQRDSRRISHGPPRTDGASRIYWARWAQKPERRHRLSSSRHAIPPGPARLWEPLRP